MNRNELDHAKTFPVMFSQVREDPRIDLEIIDTIPNKKAKVLMVASGGCTLSVLAHHQKVTGIDAVDVSPAQIDLCKLKLFLLNMPLKSRAELLGHLPLTNRLEKLTEICSSLSICPESFGDLKAVNTYGPDYIGRYEWLFRAFSERFKKTHLGHQLLQIKSMKEQKELLHQDLSEVRALFDTIFSLDTLTELFGPNAVQNRKTSYSDHFYTRFKWTLSHQAIHSNPFFYQFAYLTYPKGTQTHFLSLPQSKPNRVQFHTMDMLKYLISHQSESYDYIHLSNILDWLDIGSVKQVLDQASRVLKRGGKLSLRQLNSTVEIEDTSALSFDVLCDDTRDLSFFYPKIYVGEKS